MNWTDCPVIEQVDGKLSGAPVLIGTRVRPEDLLANIDEGPEWLSDAFMVRLEDVQTVLAFYARYRDTLPAEYISPERRQAMLSAPVI